MKKAGALGLVGLLVGTTVAGCGGDSAECTAAKESAYEVWKQVESTSKERVSSNLQRASQNDRYAESARKRRPVSRSNVEMYERQAANNRADADRYERIAAGAASVMGAVRSDLRAASDLAAGVPSASPYSPPDFKTLLSSAHDGIRGAKEACGVTEEPSK